MNVIQGVVDCLPAEAGYDASRLDALNRFIGRMIEQKSIHGAMYRLARHGKTFASAALGSRHYKDPDVLMQPDSVFGIASQTKVFVAVSVQILVEDGLLSVEDKVAKYLPQFDGPPYNEITIFHLLTHTSGLYPESGIPDMHHVSWREYVEQEYTKKGKKTDWIAAGLHGGMRLKPGQEWQYCNFGFQVLGAVIAKISGLPARAFFVERIFKPLGMTETCSPSDVAAELAQRAVVFNEWDEEWMRRAEEGKAQPSGMWSILPGTSGGMLSTTSDMLRLGQMLLNKGRLNGARVLGRKAVESLTELRLTNTPDNCWGANAPNRRYSLGLDMRYVMGALPSAEMDFHEGAGASMLIIDPREEFVGSWVIPWVGDWDNDCSRRIINTVFSGII